MYTYIYNHNYYIVTLSLKKIQITYLFKKKIETYK